MDYEPLKDRDYGLSIFVLPTASCIIISSEQKETPKVPE